MSKYDKFRNASEALNLELPEKVAEHYVPLAIAMLEACKRKDELFEWMLKEIVSVCGQGCLVGMGHPLCQFCNKIKGELNREEI